MIILGGSIFSVVKFWPENEPTVDVEQTETGASIELTSSANISLDKMENADKNAVSNVVKIVIKNETDEFVCVPFKKNNKVYFKLENVNEQIPVNYEYVTAFYDSLFTVNAISKLDDKYF